MMVQDATSLRILIIDDSPEDRQIYRRLLLSNENKYDFIEAEMGDDGINVCMDQNPDCILLDYNLPDMTGLEFMDQLKAINSIVPPVILLTGHGNEEIAVRAMKNGVQDYLVKGNISRESLYIAVENAIGKVALMREVEERNQELIKTNIKLQKEIIERKKIEEELWQSNIILTAIVEGNTDAIYVKDLQGRYLTINQAGSLVFGLPAEEIIGKTDVELLSPEIGQEIMDADRNIITSGQATTAEETLDYGDRKRFFLTTRCTLKTSTGEIIGLIGISRDITDQKQAEEERAQLMREQIARKEAEESNRIKDEFLAMLSHELRTPLTAIYGWARMIGYGQLSEKLIKDGIESIERNAKAQIRIIDDLLDISKIIKGNLNLEANPTHIMPIIEAAVETIRLPVEAKGLNLKINSHISSGLVIADPVRLQQVIWNLLSNAVKFTPLNGEIEVEVKETDSNMEISVRDNGQGIPTKFLPYVFDRFRQADSSITRKHGGLGLGLAIVRQLVELHGGTVSVYSKGENLGSTFTITLPVKSSQSMGSASLEYNLPNPHQESSSNLKIHESFHH
jgi:PAS domain S-box-containing protein